MTTTLPRQRAMDADWMVREFGGIVCCPCGGEFAGAGGQDAVRCSKCGERYALSDGILAIPGDFDTADEARAMQAREQSVRDRQARHYDFCIALNLPSVVELRTIRKRICALEPRSSLDVGCGTGRVTVELARHSGRVVAVDRSLLSLQVCRHRLDSLGLGNRVLLVQSDVGRMPVKAGAFDFVVSAQLLQHLPSDALRRELLDRMLYALHQEGRLLTSVYECGPVSLPWKRKVGQHRGGISFYRFSRAELEQALSGPLRVAQVKSCLGRLLIAEASRK